MMRIRVLCVYRKLDEASLSLALVSLRCMSGLLAARPQFNFATNIAQSLVPFLDSREPLARQIVTDACCNVFADDNKGEITLAVSSHPILTIRN
jgi:hypothetical protein